MAAPLTSALSLPGMMPTAVAKPGIAKPQTPHEKARAAAQEFEAVFLNTMFSEMFTGIDGEGPFGAGAGTGVWRSFLTDEYAKSFARAGGIGIADDVYRTLLAQQEAIAPPHAALATTTP
jgi:Rod binding domain-containing protein